MTVPNIGVLPGTQHVVGLLLTNPTVGDPSFQPGSIGEASSSSFSSGLPVYPMTLEGPNGNGSVTRFIVGVQNSETQTTAFAGSGNGLGMLYTQAYNYAYNPALVSFGNRQGIRGTGGNLVTANPVYSEGAAADDDGQRAGQDVRAFLYAVDSVTPAQAVRLEATAAGALNVATAIPGTLTTAADFLTVAATVSSIIAANTTRRVAIVQNLDAVNSVRVGDGAIGAARGVLVGPAESVTLETTAEIFVFPVAGTPTVSRTEIEA